MVKRISSSDPLPRIDAPVRPTPARRVTVTAALVVGIHFLRYAGPLIYVPMVVRLLPVAEAGSFFRLQSLAFILALLIEFGLSGTALREWARQDDAAGRSRLFNHLMAERLGNALVVFAGCGVAFALGALGAADLAVVMPFALLAGLNMTWYFMASGRPLVGSALEAGAQAVSVALLVGTMWATGSGAAAALALAAGQVVSLGVGLAAARRDGIAIRPAVTIDGRSKLAQLPMFVLRIGQMISSAGSPWVVATVGGVAQAGLYGPSARLYGAIGATLSPVGDVLIPLISRRSRAVDGHRALAVALGAFAGGALLAAVLALAAGPVAAFLYGPLGPEAVGIVRILAVSVPFTFAAQALGLFVLLPGGQERVAAVAIVAGAVVFLALACARPSAEGAAIAKVAADGVTFALIAALTFAHRKGVAAHA